MSPHLQSFVPFDLERWQSTWEHRVRFNLSESGVHPLTVAELLALAGASPAAMQDVPLAYGQSDGSAELRQAIAALYPNTAADHVTVTIGSAEANFIVCWTLFGPGRRAVIVAPTYMQMWGLAQNAGTAVVPLWLQAEQGWEPSPGAIEQAIAPETDVVIVTDPNNPTGHVLSPAAREAIVGRSRAVGAWLVVDEVFRGAERSGRTAPTWWGGTDRTIVVGGLSKAYGLPGLRIGWIVSPPDVKQALLARHDYTVIGTGPLTDALALLAVRRRDELVARTRAILNANYPLLADWLTELGDGLTWREPECGAICFVRYDHPVPSLELVERARAERDVLLVPGDHFGMPGHLRFGYGGRTDDLKRALQTLTPALREAWRA